MTAEIIAYMASSQNMERRIQFELAAHCAPFLKGMRRASILNVEKEWAECLHRLLEPTDITCRILPARRERCLALFYREGELGKMLKEEKVRRFLGGYGYAHGEPDKDIARLCERMNLYSRKKIPFPHEIGVFLDYPLEDVKAFIRNNGRESLLTGYWKVYHAPERARLIFSAYDKARDSAVNEFLIGKDIKEIAKIGV
ncbi:MAG: DUF3793 family protein [Dorea sp.]|nr:DUF3793 family protein [Dorea sp.]